MRFLALLFASLVIVGAFALPASAVLVGSGYGTHNFTVGDHFTFTPGPNPTDSSCASKMYSFKLLDVSETGKASFELNCTSPVNVYHQHAPFVWGNDSIPLKQYELYDEFLDSHFSLASADFRGKKAVLSLQERGYVTPTPTPEPSNFTRYCPNPSTEEGKCSFNYRYCRPGTLDLICDCNKCPVPKGAISPCESYCNPPTPTPTPTPLATLPPTATPATSATSTPLPSSVTGTTTPPAGDSNSVYLVGAALILVILALVAMLAHGAKK